MQVIDWSKIETKRLNSSCSKKHHENMIIESQRIRTTTKSKEQTHQDHIADRGHVSMTHYNVVHKPIPILTLMTILDAKAALQKEWTKLQKLPAWDESRATSKAEVIRRAKLEGKTVTVPSLIERICELQMTRTNREA